jgi:hypothetical protein
MFHGDTIQMLRDFDDDLFMKILVLLAEDDGLDALNLQTQRRSSKMAATLNLEADPNN